MTPNAIRSTPTIFTLGLEAGGRQLARRPAIGSITSLKRAGTKSLRKDESARIAERSRNSRESEAGLRRCRLRGSSSALLAFWPPPEWEHPPKEVVRRAEALCRVAATQGAYRLSGSNCEHPDKGGFYETSQRDTETSTLRRPIYRRRHRRAEHITDPAAGRRFDAESAVGAGTALRLAAVERMQNVLVKQAVVVLPLCYHLCHGCTEEAIGVDPARPRRSNRGGRS